MLNRKAGFTLIELMVATLVATLVIGIGFGTLARIAGQSGGSAKRLAMEHFNDTALVLANQVRRAGFGSVMSPSAATTLFTCPYDLATRQCKPLGVGQVAEFECVSARYFQPDKNNWMENAIRPHTNAQGKVELQTARRETSAIPTGQSLCESSPGSSWVGLTQTASYSLTRMRVCYLSSASDQDLLADLDVVFTNPNCYPLSAAPGAQPRANLAAISLAGELSGKDPLPLHAIRLIHLPNIPRV
jgi:prepilin-type N-terminal cleavage/methylation domain-containing protein